MSISKVKTGDKVKVISGNYKGHIGHVTKVIKHSKGKRVSISDVPKITKYRKSYTYQGQKYPGMKTLIDRFLHISNVALLDDQGKLSKTRIEIKDNKKTRVFKTTNKTVTYSSKDLAKASKDSKKTKEKVDPKKVDQEKKVTDKKDSKSSI